MKRALVAILVAGAVFGGVFAFAAGLNVDSNDLAAGSDDVNSCEGDTSEGVSTSYSVLFEDQIATSTYKLDDVTVSDIDAGCVGQDIQVTVVDAADDLIHEMTGTVTTATETFDVATENIPAADVEGIHVAITGDQP